MEELYAELLLWYIGFHSSERYHTLLDEKIINDPENARYLELEGCCANLLNSMGRFKRYWEYACSALDRDLWGIATTSLRTGCAMTAFFQTF